MPRQAVPGQTSVVKNQKASSGSARGRCTISCVFGETSPAVRDVRPAMRSLRGDPSNLRLQVNPHRHVKFLHGLTGMVRCTHGSKRVQGRGVSLTYKTSTRVRKAAQPAAADEAKTTTKSCIEAKRRIWISAIQVCPWITNPGPEGRARICAAIPSKGRWQRKDFIDHAVNVLFRHGVKQRDIYMFAIEEEYDMYRHSLDEAALWEVRLIIGRDGLTAQMNYMRRFSRWAQLSWDVTTCWKTSCRRRKITLWPPCRRACFYIGCTTHTL